MIRSATILEIGVTDMAAARRFYCDLLGLTVETEDYLPDVLVLKFEQPGPSLVLYQVETEASIDYPRQAQSLFMFEVEHLESAMQTLAEAGVELLHDQPQTIAPGRYFAIRDPFGNVHELLERTAQPSG
jgi:catechol 2,3-dioxygenase-like lactoylglutathione lyase family enzyme